MPEILTLGELDTTITPDTGDTETDFSGWYCVETRPWHCPSCGFVAYYLVSNHLIVVWPAMDDPALLKTAQEAKQRGGNPRVVEYEVAYGPCIAYDEVIRLDDADE